METKTKIIIETIIINKCNPLKTEQEFIPNSYSAFIHFYFIRKIILINITVFLTILCIMQG